MTAKTIRIEEETVVEESAAPWGRALSTNGILDSEPDCRDEQLDTAGQELIRLLFCCWMMQKKKEPLFLCKNCWHRKRKKSNDAQCSSCDGISGDRRILNTIFDPPSWLILRAMQNQRPC